MDEEEYSTERYWREYAFFTREMVRFFQKDDIEMFLTLLEEQEETIKELRQLPDDGFVNTPEGQKLKKELQDNVGILMKDVQFWLNRERTKQRTARSYDSLGENPLGQSRNWNG